MRKTRASAFSSERDGAELADELLAYIKDNNGQYLRDADGSLHVIVKGQRVPLRPGRRDDALNRLMLEACDVSTISMAAQIAIQRVIVEAAQKAGGMQIRQFSAASMDGRSLYILIGDGSLLRVSQGGLDMVVNGENEEGFWIEHPGGKPFAYARGRTGLALAQFERLLVNTQACREPAMRWFVAMNEGLFPYVRDLCPSRFLLVHIGPTQSGKTSGAQRFTLLHGLGQVKGDFSVAALGNSGDTGLLVMDNKEQVNFQAGFIDFLLFLSTGAERGRCRKDGTLRTVQEGRPVAVITTIEGVVKAELKARCVDVQYAIKGKTLQRGPIEREIVEHRDSINSGLAAVLSWFFPYSEANLPGPNPIPEFEEHFTALCNLLRAYGFLAEKPDGWVEELIQAWGRLLAERETDEDILEHPLARIMREQAGTDPNFIVVQTTFESKTGTLYVTDCSSVLTKLQGLGLPNRIVIPDTANGLSRRLRSSTFRAFRFLDEERAPYLPILKRTSKRRPIGFFFEDDTSDAGKDNPVIEPEAPIYKNE